MGCNPHANGNANSEMELDVKLRGSPSVLQPRIASALPTSPNYYEKKRISASKI